jgi:hypothetical protein
MQPSRYELLLLADHFKALGTPYSLKLLGEGLGAPECLEVIFPETFEGTDVIVRLLPLNIQETQGDNTSLDAAGDDADLDLFLLRFDALLPRRFEERQIPTLLTCLEIINGVLPFGSVVPRLSDRSLIFQYTHACDILTFQPAVVQELLNTLEFYFGLMARPLRLALSENLSPERVREDFEKFMRALV